MGADPSVGEDVGAGLTHRGEESGGPVESSLVSDGWVGGAGVPSVLTDPVVMGQSQCLIDFELSLAQPVQPDVVVPALHHVLRLDHVLAATAVSVYPLEPGGLVLSEEIARAVLHLAAVAPVEIEEDVLETEGSNLRSVELIEKTGQVIVNVGDQELVYILQEIPVTSQSSLVSELLTTIAAYLTLWTIRKLQSLRAVNCASVRIFI